MIMATTKDTTVSLSKLFSQGQEVQHKIENSPLNSNSAEYQECVVQGVGLLEEATRMVNRLSLFSRNEQLEEITTADLKYLLLPALLGDLTLQLMKEERTDVLRRARVYLCDYLQRCKDYSITTEEVPVSVSSESGKQSFAQVRQIKTSRQRLLKETNDKLKESLRGKDLIYPFAKPFPSQAFLLSIYVVRACSEIDQRLSTGMLVDEDIRREQTLLLLQSWVYKCLDHVYMIDQELEILVHMEEMRRKSDNGKLDEPKPTAVTKTPFKPILITREMIQSKVFGAGYPSLPTVSLEEFHQQQAAQLQQQQQQAAADAVLRRNYHGNIDKDEHHRSSDEDDEEALQRARQWDEFKDEHRRGEGNRKNMG